MERNRVRGHAIPYFSEPEWHKARTVMVDGHTFHATYAEFTRKVEKVQAQLTRQGTASIRVYLDVDEFAAWCTANGRQVDADSRAAFAALKAAQDDSA